MKFTQWADDTEWYDTSEGEGDLDKLLGDYDWDPNDGQDFHSLEGGGWSGSFPYLLDNMPNAVQM